MKQWLKSIFYTPKHTKPTDDNILRLLMQHAGTVFSPREIYRRVWGDSPVGVENAVAVHIRHLRSKISQGCVGQGIQNGGTTK